MLAPGKINEVLPYFYKGWALMAIFMSLFCIEIHHQGDAQIDLDFTENG